MNKSGGNDWLGRGSTDFWSRAPPGFPCYRSDTTENLVHAVATEADFCSARTSAFITAKAPSSALSETYLTT